MKGKTKSIYKLFVLVAVMLTASLCFAMFKDNTNYVLAVSTSIGGEEFSYVDNNNLIMSVEKVGVASDNDYDTPLYYQSNQDTDSDAVYDKMFGRDNVPYYYTDYYKNIGATSSTQGKYVVHNGDYVMLENKYSEDNGFYNEKFNAFKAEESKNVNIQEAIMVSFGQYVYDLESGSVIHPASQNWTDGKWSGITYLNVTARRNGDRISSLPGVREDTTSTYKDFVYIIPQAEGNEGYYEFTFEYRYNGTTYLTSFSFYILYETTYVGSVTYNNNQYSIQPTLSMQSDEGAWTSTADQVYHYTLGENNYIFNNIDQYPMLTFDYTKYKMSYTHTANGVVTSYDYRFSGGRFVVTKSTSTGSSEIIYTLDSYLEDVSNNTVTLLFTEMGSYVFEFDYIYSGYNASNAPDMSLEIDSLHMIIHGVELKYSKAGYSEAQMRYLTLAKGTDRVDLIVPNGYERYSTPSDKSLGVAYSLKTDTNIKTGVVVDTEDAKVIDITDPANIDYTITNQGSLWLSTNDSFVKNDSYYYHSLTEFTELKDDDKKLITNNTTFNKVGYYIVAVKVETNNYSIGGSPKTFMQYFAFQYTSNTLTMTVEDSDDRIIGSGEYTNNSVTVSWEPNKVFERDITAKYYTVKDKFYDKQTLLNNYTGVKFTNGATFTAQGSYLIELKSEGATTAYRMFTIDTTAIAGVSAYAVESVYFNGQNIYSIKHNSVGEPMKITNSITNDLATLYWSPKASGANITAEYTFTPFVKDTSIDINTISLSKEDWINTNYKLGDTITGFEIDKVPSLNGDIDYQYVLYNQGIYVFTLTDDAGNYCKYVFVIDNTEAYFNVDGEYLTATSYISNANVEINVGTHKVINMTNLALVLDEDDEKYELSNIINNILSGNPSALHYYVGSGNNINALRNIFTYDSSNTYFVLKVANRTLTSYKGSSGTETDSATSISSIAKDNSSTTVTKSADEHTSSTLRRMYLLGSNQTDTTTRESKSYIMIEVNTDNAKGMIFSTNNESLTIDNIESKVANENSISTLYRRYTGKTVSGADATSDNYLAFTWNVGSGDYEVVTVEMQYYKFSADSDSKVTVGDKDYYYYDGATASPPTTLYDKSTATQHSSVTFNANKSRGMALLNVANKQTIAGLYAVTRYYDWPDDHVDLDSEAWTYYIIVDRNGIITAGTVIGGDISIGLLDNEENSNFYTFNSIGGLSGSFSGDEFINQTYNIYLNTNKVPAIMNVPLYKYFDGLDKSSSYEAGALDIKLYYVDYYHQLSRGSIPALKLYDSTSERYIHSDSSEEGYYLFSIIDNIKKHYPEYTSRFTNEGKISDGSYLCLQGDYILVIRDRVKNNNASYSAQKIIGMRIQADSPNVDIYSVSEVDNGIDLKQDYISSQTNSLHLTTNDEFVKINLDQYLPNKTSAQIDVNYLVVKNETTGEYFINYPYEHIGGSSNLSVNGGYVNNVNSETVARIITLDTGMVRNADGSINVEATMAQQWEYKITVRFKLSHDGKNAKYANCYYNINIAQDGTVTYNTYYEKTYTVTIDREAPTRNIETITSSDNDKLLAYYTEQPSMQAKVYDDVGGIYYVYQYSKYFEQNPTDNADIYAFLVNTTTSFDYSEINRFYYRPFNIASDKLSLPITNYSGYTEIATFYASNYGSLGIQSAEGSPYNKYYEILEQDTAGNICQYVIYYVENTSDIEASDLQLNIVDGIVLNDGIVEVTDINPYQFTSDSFNTVFAIDEIDATGTIADKFYRIELWANNELKRSINTNATTIFDSDNLGADIVNMFSAGFGNYTLKVISRNDTLSYGINYLDKDNIERLDVELLVNNNILTFGAANILTTSDSGNSYYSNYASVITITYTDTNGETVSEEYTVVTNADDSNNNYKLYNGPDGAVESINLNGIDTNNGTIIIEVQDPFETDYNIKRINLNGQDFESIKIGEYVGTGADALFVEREYHHVADTYYTYHNALVEYDTTIYEFSFAELRLDNVSILADTGMLARLIVRSESNGFGYVYIKGYLGSNNVGGILEATINLKYKGEVELTYKIVIDTYTGNVMLRDTNNNAQDLKIDVNTNYTSTSYNSTASGTMNLSWTTVNNDYFVYEYLLHEFMIDGTIVTETMSTNNTIIYTEDDSMGKYVFEIKVYTKDNKYLGNKLYTFSVQAILNQLYYFKKNASGEAVGANSTFYFNVNGDWSLDGIITRENVLSKLGVSELTTNEIPLYVYNETLTISLATDQGAGATQLTQTIDGYELTIYRVYTTTYSIYVATLRVPKSTEILDSTKFDLNYNSDTAKLLEEEFDVTSGLSYNIYSANALKEVDEEAGEEVSDKIEYEDMGAVSLQFNISSLGAKHYLTSKNIVTVDVYHNDIFVGTYDEFEVNSATGIATLTILGSGKFTFVFKDLAGNVHNFTLDSGLVQDSVDITVVRDMILTVNGEVPIDNGFYNDVVIVSVYNPSIYDIGTISLKNATRNGVDYQPTKSYSDYIFAEYGTYRVTFEAGFKGVVVNKTIVFTRVNVREARESIDLSSIGNYDITKVTNINDEDVTSEFLRLIHNNAVTNGMYVTYERLMENSEALGVTTGKQTFTITYSVQDEMYPKRTVAFAFTLNNEQPTIECSLKNGETTTKGFSLKLNGGIVYEQVGESLLYINDKLLMRIDENSNVSLTEITINRSEYGSGEYYIKLMSSSGNVIDSFKVTIKDPLNSAAIIVIIVVVGIVIGVIISIVILRRKMRIR